MTSTLPTGPIPVAGGDYAINYTITNPITGVSVVPVVTGDFITIDEGTRAAAATQEGTVNFIVAENTTTAIRTGSIALKYNDRELATVEITQDAGEPEDTANWLFEGADFNAGSLPDNIVADQASLSYRANGGVDNSGALYASGTASANGVAFKINVPSEPVPAITSSVSFFIKGTATGKSLAIRTSDTSYFNLGDVSVDKTYTAANQADYTGGFNTNGNLIKITLPMTSAPEYIEFRWGSGGRYYIFIDNITFE